MALRNNILRAEALICPDSIGELQELNARTSQAALDLIGRPEFLEPPPLNPRVIEEVDCGLYVRKKVRYGNELEFQHIWELFGSADKFKAIHLEHTHRYSPEAARFNLSWFNRWL